ncbi:LuxR C-terminal-related transcriptional regulator [Paeniglutamicibacter sp. NPDC012692]|uniref:LuxR C-terminal-related transcriptional regulator n=1 Tax=Paeniglutamicibacter sp. NPDC012692 TaxID=3364388 RepID=UPI0036ABCE9D
MKNRFVTIGVAARESGVSEWRLRSWEDSGLLSPVRSAGGYRLFNEETIDRARKLAVELEGTERLGRLGMAHAASVGIDPIATAPAVDSDDTRMVTQFELLRSITHDLQSSDDTQRSVVFVLAQVASFLGADAAAIALADLVRQKIEVYCTLGLSDKFTQALGPWKLGQGYGGQVYALRESISIPDLLPVARLGRDMIAGEGLRAYACVPLLRGLRRVGLLEMYKRSPEPFRVEDVAFLEMVSAIVTPYIESGRLERKVHDLRQERARHFRTLVSQFSGTLARQREQHFADLHAFAAEFGEPGIGRQETDIAAGLAELAQRAERLHHDEFDFLELVRTGIVDRFSQERGLQCSLEIGNWPSTLSTSLASRLYLLLVRLAEEIAAVADGNMTIKLDSLPDRIWIGLDYSTGRQQPSDPYAPSDDAAGIIEELGASIGTSRSPQSSSVSVSVPRRRGEDRGDLLTRRERETLEAMRGGLSNKEIAGNLRISSKTLQNHITAIYRKLQVSNRGEAIAFFEDSAN